MLSNNLFIIILILFIVFIFIQIYFYSNIFKKNNNLINDMEKFENTLIDINNKNYILDDNSIEFLLDDYNNLKNNI
jgi:predicted PurR-regulated permease PerM